LFSISSRRPARILRLLGGTPKAQPLDRQLPEPPASTMLAPTLLCRRSAWTSTLTAGLELAKPGEVALTQEGVFSTLHVSPGRRTLAD